MRSEVQIHENDLFAGILAAIDYDQPTPEIIHETRARTLADTLDSMIGRGTLFDVAKNDFEIVGGDLLTESEKDYLKINRAPILCTLQQSLLMKHLFSHSKHLFSDYAFEVAERQAIIGEGAALSYEVYFESVRDVTAKWFSDLLKKL